MKIEDKEFKFSFPIQVRWSDLDALGHVNNAVFATYFEIARGVYMLTTAKTWDWHKHMFLIGNINIDFKKEILLTSKDVKVYVRTSKIGTKSFVLEYAIVSTKNDENVVHAMGTTTQIMFDMAQKSTVEVYDWLRNDLSDFDGI